MRAVLFVLLLTACDSHELDTRALPVVNGSSPSPGQFPGVGGFYLEGTLDGVPVAQVGCSGALVAPDVVLTAAHCFPPHVIEMLGLPLFSIDEDTGAAETTWTASTSVRRHESFVANAGFQSVLASPHDVALVYLAGPVPGGVPMPLTAPIDADELAVGLPLVLVGYGQTTLGDVATQGSKRTAPARVTEVGLSELRELGFGEPVPCVASGDSGSPMLATIGGTTRVVGVTSHSGAASVACESGAIAERVDVYADWIVTHAGSVCDTSPEACVAPDAGPTPPDAGLPDAVVPDAAQGATSDAAAADLDDTGAGGCGCRASPTSSRSGRSASGAVLVLLAAVAWRRRDRRAGACHT